MFRYLLTAFLVISLSAAPAEARFAHCCNQSGPACHGENPAQKGKSCVDAFCQKCFSQPFSANLPEKPSFFRHKESFPISNESLSAYNGKLPERPPQAYG